MKKHNNSEKKSEPTSKRTKSPGPVRDTKEVLAELVAKAEGKAGFEKSGSNESSEANQKFACG